MRTLPDIASHVPAQTRGTIDRVGMEHIDVPILIRDPSGRLVQVPGRANAFVSLDDPNAKGIHMSRLFLALQEIVAKEPATIETLRQVVDAFIVSHEGLSRAAHVELGFDYLVSRPALESDHAGWKSYRVEIAASREDDEERFTLSLRIPYSSTCPCSAALSRQLGAEAFAQHFGAEGAVDAADVAAWLRSDAGMVATPHSQRSWAEVEVEVAPTLADLPILPLIDAIECALGTPVQSAVKREDEQAFAALNASNLMFCEDASRRIAAALDRERDVLDYRIRVQHEESLHPHDAVSVLTRARREG